MCAVCDDLLVFGAENVTCSFHAFLFYFSTGEFTAARTSTCEYKLGCPIGRYIFDELLITGGAAFCFVGGVR